jgi:hypothetical protein
VVNIFRWNLYFSAPHKPTRFIIPGSDFYRHLKLKSSFEAALKDTLAIGGDTDTNAAIVCAMMGALHGASKISERLKAPVLANNEETANRPSFLVPSQVPSLANRLFDLAKAQI